MGNYVTAAGNYVIVSPSELGNYKIADTLADQAEYAQRMFLKIQRIIQQQQEVRCLSIFTIIPAKRRATGTTFELRLYCEEPGAWHPWPEFPMILLPGKGFRWSAARGGWSGRMT